MAGSFRSRRARLAALSQRLRAEGQTWAQIAAVIQRDERVNARVAMRLAHGYTQTEVARLWNAQWPAAGGSPGINDKHVSGWETWPQSGHEPSLRTYKRLAQLYQCDIGDLMTDGSYRHLDTVVPNTDAMPTSSSLVPLTAAFGRDVGGKLDDRWTAGLQRIIRSASDQHASPLQREVLYEQLVHLMAGWANSMKRRDLLKLLGWAATAAAAAPVFPGLELDEQERIVRALDTRHRIDEPAIRSIEAVLWAAMHQDDALGPQAALDTVLAQRNLVRATLPDCPSRLRPRLLSLFSNMSRFAGWLSFDLNDFASAAHYYEQARTAAHEAEDTELGIFVLCNMSHLATWRGQPRVGIDHAVAAQGWASETDDLLLRAYVADVGARAYAAAGKRQMCLDLLDSIPHALAHVATASTPASSLVYFYGPGQYAVTRSRCLLDLHDTAGAVQAAQESLRLVGDPFVRNRAFGTLHLGNAYIESGEIERAAHVIADGAELATRNRSTRVVHLLHRSRNRLHPWRQTAAVKALDERLTSYGFLAGSSSR